jgi:2-amino-4-hydroxy-6-hydroxymethyldihydropteridine diphosphokinase
VPASDQPDYVNAVVAVTTPLPPGELLAALHRIEAAFGRVRTVRNAARRIDLDLLAYHDLVDEVGPPILPHPRLAERAFVLCPLSDVAPGWTDPRSGRTVEELLRALPPGQSIRLLE